MSDETKKAEARGYSRGYSAGRKRKQREIDNERRRAKDNALWQRMFLCLLPTAMQVQGWSVGDKPITSGEDRVRLAKIWADRALLVAKREGRA